ncbi:MAG: hypothetical protein RLP44_18620 [Aggregatilineales bacterium]
MKRSHIIILVVVTVLAIVGIIALTLVLTPEKTSPAFDAAVRFTNAAGVGDDDIARALLTPDMQTYVDENCPDGSVSACILAYTPPEWGTLIRDGSAVYRRSIQDGDAWDVLLVATYQEEEGFAGVCIYNRVEKIAEGDWRVAGWSGFVSCDESNAGLQSLRRADAPNAIRP